MTDSTQNNRVPKAGLIVLAVVAVVIGGLFLISSDRPDKVPPTSETSLPLARIIELKNIGVANLENNELDKAEACFEEVIELLPKERFGLQNLAITQLLKIAPENLNRADNPVAFDIVFEKAHQTVDGLRQQFPDDPKVHVLAARLALRTEDHAAAVVALSKAAELAPADAAIQFGIFDAGRYSRKDELTVKADKGLEKAWKLAPENLYVMREWLTVQARAKDPMIEETLTTARKLVAPFVERIAKFTNVNLHELIDRGLAAVPEEEWNTVTRSAIVVGNMLRPEVATQNDAKKVTPHLLEFIVHDFSDFFYQRNRPPMPELPEAIPVTFEFMRTPFQNLTNVKQVHVVDIDIDHLLLKDVVVVQNDRISVWSEAIDGEPIWTEVVSLNMSDNGLPSKLSGICLFDLDRDAAVIEHASVGEKMLCADADLDILAYGAEGLVVLRNDIPKVGDNIGVPTLVPVKQSEGFETVRNVLAVCPVDFDHDGDLDLVVSAESGISLWLNRDDSTFVDHSRFSILPPVESKIHKLIAVDWDRNVSIDILAFGQDMESSGILKNLLHGQLRWETYGKDSALSGAVFDAEILDADSNASWDLATVSYAATTDNVYPKLTMSTTSNPDAGVVIFESSEELSIEKANGISSADLDNDGFIDLATWCNKRLVIHRGGPQATFQSFSESPVDLPSEISECTPADFDSDGDIDLIVVCENSVEVLINEGGNANNWIDIPIRAETAQQAQKPNERVNIHGVGSLLELRSGLAYQPQVVTGRTTHFGLGKRKPVDSARVLWTNGIPEHIVNPQHGQPICLQQQLKGSCPYLYTWDGERFAFYTDCLWAAPIGLQLAEGHTGWASYEN